MICPCIMRPVKQNAVIPLQIQHTSSYGCFTLVKNQIDINFVFVDMLLVVVSSFIRLALIGGYCNDTHSCVCHKGFVGDDCEIG